MPSVLPSIPPRSFVVCAQTKHIRKKCDYKSNTAEEKQERVVGQKKRKRKKNEVKYAESERVREDVTYFLKAVEMADLSPVFGSSLEKNPKPVEAGEGFGGLFESGPLMLLQPGAPLPVERETVTSG